MRLQLAAGWLAAALSACAWAGCGGDDSKSTAPDSGVDSSAGDAAPADATSSDAGDGGALDNGEACTTYPAFKPPVPQIVKSVSGAVVVAPKIRHVYFQGDTVGPAVDAAITQWLASPVWPAQTSEYGVGAASATSVTLGEAAPTMIDDAGIQAWLRAKLGGAPDAGADAGADPAFGATDTATLASTVFVLFYPATTTVSAQGAQGCVNFGAYHSETTVAGKPVQYAVIPRCSGGAATLVQSAMFSALAFATNPGASTTPAYEGFDDGHLAWGQAFGDEIPTACVYEPAAMLDGGAYWRSWSNSAMAAYHDPCVPYPDSQPYFAAAPTLPDTVTLLGAATKAVKIPVGQSKTIEVQLFSDGPTSGPWTVSIANPTPSAKNPTASFDRTTGTNGEKLHLTLTANSATPQPFIVVSALGGRKTYWAGLVVGQ
jgi:hypothetical protein